MFYALFLTGQGLCSGRGRNPEAYLSDENEHPLLQIRQLGRHPFGLVEEGAGGVVVAI